ncbi:glutamine amidotransferase [Chromobacterium sp. Panama]|uniref:DJ-1/PfpI family protein n=1 Tax=Chromobacterium sp. Panama TaxID=2161826 RepID=UPI000D30A660|nr:DJ-1/PfpI family protein [Chromobacterium sp. Panama]PTU67256.1 glutamine amidotransferase [Chromobacterium sp. Panama]
MKKAVFFLLDEYAEWESAFLSSRLAMSKQWSVATASLERGVCKSMGGFTTVVDYALMDIPGDTALLVLVGGNAWGLDSSELRERVAACLATGVVVAAICGAVDFLARNGLLNDYRHTGNAQHLWAEYPEYRHHAGFIAAQTVRDRNLITANGTAAMEFSESVLKSLHAGDSAGIEMEHKLFKMGYHDYVLQYGNPFA